MPEELGPPLAERAPPAWAGKRERLPRNDEAAGRRDGCGSCFAISANMKGLHFDKQIRCDKGAKCLF